MRVELTEDALEDLRRLAGSAQKMVLKGLRKLEAAPDQYGEPLGRRPTGDLTGFRKLVVGRKAYRIVYVVHDDDDDVKLVVVWVLAERSDDRVYELALSRLKTMKRRDIATELEQLILAVWRG